MSGQSIVWSRGTGTRSTSVARGFAGDLTGISCSINNAWIVLRRVSESRHDVAVPATSKALAKTQVSQPQIARRIEYLWIPREAATIVGRVVAVKPLVGDEIGESPALGAVCQVVAATGELTEETEGRLIELTAEQAVIRQQLRVDTKRVVPYVGELPYVGALFRSVQGTDEERRIEVPKAALMCIRVIEAAFDAVRIETCAREVTPSHETSEAKTRVVLAYYS